jgi:hypothetical protein
MPVFHVDIKVGDSLVEDLEGVEFPNLRAAEAHCIAGLMEVARSLVSASTLQSITATLRNEARTLILQRTCTLTCEIR